MPPMTNVTMKPIAQSIGVPKRMRPPYMVNSQLKTFTPVGTAMIIVIDAEDGIDVGARAHREEVVQPDHEGEDADRHGRGDHRAIAEQRLAGEGRDHLGEDAERRQDQDVDLRMAPDPDQVHVHHRVAARLVREEVEAEITVEQQHRERRGQDRKGRDDEQVGGERRPAEHRHAQVAHARRAHLQDRGHEIDAGQQRADAGDLQRPEVVVDADAGRVGQLGQRRIGQPAGPRELADDQRDVDQQRARSRSARS